MLLGKASFGLLVHTVPDLENTCESLLQNSLLLIKNNFLVVKNASKYESHISVSNKTYKRGHFFWNLVRILLGGL